MWISGFWDEARADDQAGVLDDPLDAILVGSVGADWLVTDTDRPTIALAAPDRPVTVWLEMRATFGPYEHRWSQGPFSLEAWTTSEVTIEVPVEARMHELASSYVTYLFVRAEVEEADGGTGQESLVRGFIVWPEGPQGAAVVWSHEEGRSRAPTGRLGDTTTVVRTELGDAVVVRLPPVAHEVQGRARSWDDLEVPSEHVTEDDQSDEGVR